MLNDALKSGSYDFQLFNNGNEQENYDAVVFFLHDEIEFIDLVKLYRPQTPFVLGSAKINSKVPGEKTNMFTIDLNQTKDGIEKKFIEVFKQLHRTRLDFFD